MTTKTARNAQRTRGFSLLEVLLSVGVFSVFFLSLIQIGQSISENQVRRAAANYVSQLDRAVQILLGAPNRFSVVYNQVRAAGNIAQISVENLRDGTGMAGLPPSPVLGANFSPVAPYRQTYRIVMRVADNPAITTDAEALEVYIASETLIPDEDVRNIAGLIPGGNGGALRDTAGVALGTLRAAYGNWTAPVANLLGSAWYTTVTSSPVPTIANGGYVISYHYYNIDKVARDYLYRTNVGDASMNAMASDLSLGNYNLLGADDVATTNTFEGEQVIVQGATTLTGAAAIAGNLQADGPSGTGSLTGTGASTVDVQFSAPTSEVTVAGSTSAESGVFAGSLDTATMNVGQLTASNTLINGGTVNAVNSRGIFAGVQPAGLNVTGGATVGQLKTTNLTANNLTQNGGTAAALYLQVDNNASLGGGMTAQRFNFGGQARVRSLQSCGEGC